MSKRGRPSQGLTESRVEVRAPRRLVREVAKKAKQEKITASEGWRRAGEAWVSEKPKAG